MLRYYKHLRCFQPYVKAFSLSLHAKPSALFRKAIAHQETALKKQLAEELGAQRFSLDHHPIPFSALKRIFLKQKGFDPDISLPYGTITVELLEDWQHFHGSLAEYRVVDVQFNHFINGWYSTYWHDLDRWVYFSCRGTY
jgi:hypothetical protein